MSDFKERLSEEKAQLTERLSKLVVFLGSEVASTLDIEDLQLLMRQAEVMIEYQRILVLRIRRFIP